MDLHRLVWVAALALCLTGCGQGPQEIPKTPPPPLDMEALRAEFKREVVHVTDGVYVAVGFGLANSILLEGAQGVVIVDTMESRSRAEAVLAAFREITDKPIRAVILTHNHADHVFGGEVFTGGNPDIPVYAHDSLNEHVDRIVNLLNDAIYVRSMRMFGQMLPEEIYSAAGIGMNLDMRIEEIAMARPTHTFRDRLELEIEGIRLELIHAPGETPDQIIVWMPEKKVLLPADNIYKAFPNLYTIRGTAYRDVMDWVHSIDVMRDLEADYLVPHHTRPLSGKEAIAETLTAYRDAIQFVHDQTLRRLNKGETPDEIATSLYLPPHLATHPYLQPTYGAIDFSVRSIAAGYLGWFGGDAVQLQPLPPDEAALKIFEALAAGKPLPQQAQEALEAGEYQWAAELARHWTRLEPEEAQARTILAEALHQLGVASKNFGARNYYLSQAQEWRGNLHIAPNDTSKLPESFLDSLPIEKFLQAMTVRLKAEETLEEDLVVLFRFSDQSKSFTLYLRRGVAELRARGHDSPDLTLSATTGLWKRIATKKQSAPLAYAAGNLQIDGEMSTTLRFLSYFER